MNYLATGLIAFFITQFSYGAHASNTWILAVANSESFDTDLDVLKYPKRDLSRFVTVMGKTGQVPKEQINAIYNEDKATFVAKIKKIRDDIRNAHSKEPAKFLLYYTGHSDAEGLHFPDDLLSKKELHELLQSVPVKTRIALLDSCYSGALAEKGIRPAESFKVPKAEFDEPSGSVFLAATSDSDVAFEIEELKGSLFTHHLVSGLYGQADNNRDGFVTINELYQYVYRQMTLESMN